MTLTPAGQLQTALSRARWWIAGVVLTVALVTLIYGRVGTFGFVIMDDPLVLRDNPWLASGWNWESVQWALTANLTAYSEQAEYWEPLTLMSRLADAQWFGMNAGAFHLMSVGWHLVNTLLVALALRSLTGERTRPAVVALLFLVHPLNVEPVCWLSARKDLLNATFYLGTLLAYAEYCRRPNVSRYLLVLLVFAGCLMAKPMGVSLPFLLLLLDWWPLRRWLQPERVEWGRVVMEKIPLLLMAGAAAALALRAQKNWGAMAADSPLSLPWRVANALVSYATYTKRLFWGDELAIYYPHPGKALPVILALLAGVFLIGVSYLAWRTRKQAPYFLAGWIWFGLLLGPVIGLVQIGAQGMADRYMYLAGLGMLMAVVWAVAEFVPGRWTWPAAMMAIGLCTALSAQQTGFWRSSETVFDHAIAVTRGNSMAHLSLGCALWEDGMENDARMHLQRSVEISPTLHPGWQNLGRAEAALGHYKEAIHAYASALELRPREQADMVQLGRLLEWVGRKAEAEAVFRHMRKLAPRDPQSFYLLGDMYSRAGQWKESAVEWQAWLEIRPDDKEAKRWLGMAQAEMAK